MSKFRKLLALLLSALLLTMSCGMAFAEATADDAAIPEGETPLVVA